MRLTADRGASLLEMMFAMAIVALAMPFAYRQVADIGENLRILAIAKQISADTDPVKNFMRLHAEEFPKDEVIEVETEAPDQKIYVSNSADGLWAFIVLETYRDDLLQAHKIAAMAGADAAVMESDGMAYSGAGNWSVGIPDAEEGDIVYRIKSDKMNDDTAKYLHRTILSEGELSTMKRDLSMGNFSMSNANEVDARKLDSADLDAYLAKTNVIAANSLYFSGGLNLNPESSLLRNIRVNGDTIGFRNIYTDNFSSPGGALTTDRASIAKSLVVSKKFEVKSPYSRTASGFAGVSAGNVRTAYLDTTNLTFLPGFGLTISSELLYSSTPPIKLGQWSFPNSSGAGPKFSKLKLGNLSDQRLAFDAPDFSEILKEGWR